MDDYKFTFVILHYLTYNETIACVSSILESIHNNIYNIVIVDNGSKNESGELLQQKFASNKKVYILLNQKNIGFSGGMNIGYRYAKYKLNAKFIVILNNDTIINDNYFIENALEKYSKYSFHILGPDIISIRTGEHQNPRKETLTNVKIIRKFITNFKFLLFLNYLSIDEFVLKFKKKIIPGSKLPSSIDDLINPENNELLNVKLHGSALIYSPKYINKYDFAFYPGTFMYNEESILYYIVRRDNLKTLYTPDIKVYHKEDATTDVIFKKSLKKRRFYYKNFIKSGEVLLKLMEE